MTKPHILQLGPYAAWDEEPLTADYVVHRYFEAADKAVFLAEVGPLVQGIATKGDLGANAALIAACPNLEVIAIFGVGYDAVDLEACRARGIKVA
ncbi:MAG: 2-hydroxyacid dehydrogenase, partial [Paracoccaceae bacterium]